MVERNQSETVYPGFLPDARLEQRAQQILHAIQNKQSAIANRYCADDTEEMGNRRFMNNDRIENESLKQAAYAFCRERAAGKYVLAIEDSVEINLQHHRWRLDREDQDLGPVGNDTDLGFFLHPVLAMDAETQFPLGFSSIHDWNRRWDKIPKAQRKYKSQDLDRKESRRWLTGLENTIQNLPDARQIVGIADRESDIYELFAQVPKERIDLLIRCGKDRALHNRPGRLFQHLASRPVAGETLLEIQGSKKRKKRTAHLEIRYDRVSIARPAHRRRGTLPPYVEVNVIEIREKAESVPEGEEPILWRLVTTLEIRGLEDAIRYAYWYSLRWWIEQLFRVLKSDGLDLEAAQWETGSAMKRLAILALQAALQILQLTAARGGDYEIAPEMVFTAEELEYQERLLPELEGNTEKKKNPFPRSNLAWSAWIIARLGGWKTYYSPRAKPPGPLTMKRGLECFRQQFAGWRIASAAIQPKDVYGG